MSTWTVKAHELLRAQAQVLCDILNSTEPEDLKSFAGATGGGDERKLRGIPAIGRGVQGHIPGTSPHAIR